ncbi:UNKNOWN [Stylonychia lemnae]|uniref:Uncharacterized protein n=1 Tax=Stylonychia lemnae TaxID=5949 RepID=A0A078A9J3_STYLE|nr:UNKNOWN [Stylonychia lemnae]|eukprot:CDW78536.1 UNKNOWN [Stylonychia lemnae]
MLHSSINDSVYQVPLRNQTVNAQIFNSIATIDIIQTFYNDTQDPLEVTVNIPIDEDYGIGKLTVEIGDQVIEGKILEKQKAQEKYEDAIAQGHTATIASEDNEKDEIIKLTIGNLLPGQEAKLEIQLLNVLKIEGAAYCLRIPLNYFPNYEAKLNGYSYKFQVEIHSDTPITYLSHPNSSKIVKETSDENLLHIKLEKTQENVYCLDNDLVVYYRTNDMESTVLFSQESESHPDQVAVMLSVLPSFIEQTTSVPSLDTYEEEIPDPQDVQYINPGDCIYIFLVDRSGSMRGDKMQTTKEALKLFLKSLPPRSNFEIISFGTQYTVLSGSPNGLEYNDITINNAMNQIESFQADMGGTEIYQPLEYAISGIQTKLQKRIFMLTDGEVSNRNQVVELAGKCPYDVRIHSIGIGRGCDVRLVSDVATQGKGSCSLVVESKDLKAIVIKALARAKDPSYSNCKFILSQNPIISANNLKHNLINTTGFELFRNEIFLILAIIPKQDFENLRISASSDINPISNKGINYEWSAADFRQLNMGNELFKIAARMSINELSIPASKYSRVPTKDIEKISIEYQVLSKYTAFLAVNQNDEKPIGELKQINIKQEDSIPIERNEKRCRRRVQPTSPTSQVFSFSSSNQDQIKKKKKCKEKKAAQKQETPKKKQDDNENVHHNQHHQLQKINQAMADTEMAEEEEREVETMQIDDQIYLEGYNNNQMQGLIKSPLKVSQLPMEEQKYMLSYSYQQVEI